MPGGRPGPGNPRADQIRREHRQGHQGDGARRGLQDAPRPGARARRATLLGAHARRAGPPRRLARGARRRRRRLAAPAARSAPGAALRVHPHHGQPRARRRPQREHEPRRGQPRSRAPAARRARLGAVGRPQGARLLPARGLPADRGVHGTSATTPRWATRCRSRGSSRRTTSTARSIRSTSASSSSSTPPCSGRPCASCCRSSRPRRTGSPWAAARTSSSSPRRRRCWRRCCRATWRCRSSRRSLRPRRPSSRRAWSRCTRPPMRRTTWSRTLR